MFRGRFEAEYRELKEIHKKAVETQQLRKDEVKRFNRILIDFGSYLFRAYTRGKND